MENENKVLPIFYECTVCHRNIFGTAKLWADIDKRICSCCECMGATDEDSIKGCRRISCKFHHHIYDDYITEATEPPKTVEQNKKEQKKGAAKEYDEKNHLCYACSETLFDEYIFVNAKFSLFELDNDKTPAQKTQVKIKFCKKCFDKIFAEANIEFKNSDKQGAL